MKNESSADIKTAKSAGECCQARYLPKTDRLFWLTALPTLILTFGGLAISFLEPPALFIMIPTALSVVYFLFSPLFGYVELTEHEAVIKYGLFLKKEIAYTDIRGVEVRRRIISDSIMSLKCAMEDVTIRFNRFDITVVSVKDNQALKNELLKRCGISAEQTQTAKTP